MSVDKRVGGQRDASMRNPRTTNVGVSRKGSRSKRFKARDLVASVTVGVVVLTVLEIAVAQGFVSSLMLPQPSNVWQALVDGFLRGTYWEPIQSTLGSVALGFSSATLVGVMLASLLILMPRTENVVKPYIVALQSLPKIAIAPLIVIWAGFGIGAKTLTVAVVAFFPIFVNTLQGLRIRNSEYAELMVALGASRWETFRNVRFPGALSYIFAGLHVGIILSVTGAIVAEFVGSRTGLGVMLLQQRALFNVPGVFAVLTLLMILGVSLHLAMGRVERRLVFWEREKSGLEAQGGGR